MQHFSISLPIDLCQLRATITGLIFHHSISLADQQRCLPGIFLWEYSILHELGDKELIKKCCLNHAGTLFVTDLVKDTLQSDTKRSQTLTAEMIMITLHFLATGNMQQCNSDGMGVNLLQQAELLPKYLMLSIEIMSRFITFPHTVDGADRRAKFFCIAQFFSVIRIWW